MLIHLVEPPRVEEASAAQLVEADRSQPRVVGPGLFHHHQPVRELLSPTGARYLTVREGNLQLRNARSDETTTLTRDGSTEQPWQVAGASFSPSGRLLAALRRDERGVPRVPLVDYLERPETVEWIRYSRAGDPIPRLAPHVLPLDGGPAVPLDTDPEEFPHLFFADWSPDEGELFFVRGTRLLDRLDLVAADTQTGETRVMLTELSSTYLVGLPMMHGYASRGAARGLVTVLDGGERFLWRSNRHGADQLYLYDGAGELLRRLTDFPLGVGELRGVADGWAYVTAAADPARPYEQHLYRVSLSEDQAQTHLLGGPHFHEVELVADGAYFWAYRSGLDVAPQLSLHRADGTLVRRVWTADTSFLDGWRPERFAVPAPDGDTLLHGLLLVPDDFDADREYPVVENIYAGPFEPHVPQTIFNPGLWSSQALAQAGFVVFFVDGRGTPGRGRTFRDATYGRFGQTEIAEHVHALRTLAEERPYLDLDRVGIMGHSWGGYFSVRAMLTRPDVYKAAIAMAPPADLAHFRVPIEPYMGCLPADCPDDYAAGANTPLAGELEGALMIVHGTHDDDVPLGESMRLIAALNDAGKQCELMIVPGADHLPMLHPAFEPRMLHFFNERLRQSSE